MKVWQLVIREIETYSEPIQTSRMELLVNILLKDVKYLAKSPVFDV